MSDPDAPSGETSSGKGDGPAGSDAHADGTDPGDLPVEVRGGYPTGADGSGSSA